MLRTTMLALVAVLALQPQDSLAHHIVTEEQAIAAFLGLQTRVEGLEQAKDNDTLGGLGCATDQIARFNGIDWACSEDEIGVSVVLRDSSGDLIGPMLDHDTLVFENLGVSFALDINHLNGALYGAWLPESNGRVWVHFPLDNCQGQSYVRSHANQPLVAAAIDDTGMTHIPEDLSAGPITVFMESRGNSVTAGIYTCEDLPGGGVSQQTPSIPVLDLTQYQAPFRIGL